MNDAKPGVNFLSAPHPAGPGATGFRYVACRPNTRQNGWPAGSAKTR